MGLSCEAWEHLRVTWVDACLPVCLTPPSHDDAVEDLANTVGASCDAVRDEEREEESSSEEAESSF